MVVVKKVGRSAAPTKLYSSNDDDDGDMRKEKEGQPPKSGGPKVEEQSAEQSVQEKPLRDDRPELSSPSAELPSSPFSSSRMSPLTENWGSWLSSIQTIGSTLATRANQAMDQLYELASAPLPGDATNIVRFSPTTINPSDGGVDEEGTSDKEDGILHEDEKEPSSTKATAIVRSAGRRGSVTAINDNKKDIQRDLADIKSHVAHKKGPTIETQAKDDLADIVPKPAPTETHSSTKKQRRSSSSKGPKKLPKSDDESSKTVYGRNKLEDKVDTVSGKDGNSAVGDKRSHTKTVAEEPTEPSKVLASQTQMLNDQTQRLVAGLGSLVSKAKVKYQDLTTITGYSQHSYPTCMEAFVAFGGQAALTRLQLQSSQAVQAFKKRIRTMKPPQAKALAAQAKELECSFDALIEQSLDVANFAVDTVKPEALKACLSKPVEDEASTKEDHGRCHLAHLAALSCELFLPTPGTTMDESREDVVTALKGLQWLSEQYGVERVAADFQMLRTLLAEAALQIPPILKQRL